MSLAISGSGRRSPSRSRIAMPSPRLGPAPIPEGSLTSSKLPSPRPSNRKERLGGRQVGGGIGRELVRPLPLAGVRPLLGPLAVGGGEQIEDPVPVVVQEGRGGVEVLHRGPCGGGDVLEAAVAPVAVHADGAEGGEHQVFVPVPVQVGGRPAIPALVAFEPRLRGDVHEGQAPQVAVQAGLAGGPFAVDLASGEVAEEEVLPAVSVAVQHQDAGPLHLGQIGRRQPSGAVDEVDPGLLGHVHELRAGSPGDGLAQRALAAAPEAVEGRLEGILLAPRPPVLEGIPFVALVPVVGMGGVVGIGCILGSG